LPTIWRFGLEPEVPEKKVGPLVPAAEKPVYRGEAVMERAKYPGVIQPGVMGIGGFLETQCPGEFFTALPDNSLKGTAGYIGPSARVFFEQPVDQEIPLP
jgi:hypothetical protein